MSELTDRIRAQQAGVIRLTSEQVSEVTERPMREHGDHPWHRVGSCVYCGPCGVRLYQGTMPADHPVWRPKPKATKADEMLRRWKGHRGA